MTDLMTWVTDPRVILVFVIVFATLLLNFMARRLFIHLGRKVQGTSTIWDDALFQSVRKPLAWLIWVVGISWAAEIIVADTDTDLAQIIDPVRYVSVVGLLALFLTKFISETEKAFIHQGSDVTTASAVGKLLRISVLITATLSILQTLGINIAGILAFGGIGGIAVGFAARDILANFFGGLMIYLDRPFKVGDWIRSPDREIEGTVVNIGWRLTEILTFDKRPLYIPNMVFANITLENPSRMLNRRIYETVGIRYDDVSKMAAIVDDVRGMLQNHPEIDPDKTLIVNFNGFAPSSCDFFVYTFTRTTDWIKFHHIKENVLLKIVEIIESHGAEIAFPTSTVHLIDPEPDVE
ncbi:MAG: mechanosensitive ion channel family protein [Gammaproteobacteria bacterium]|nr:mechanosensitive ion channel family protein [Gammaproteobacteria bacterium]